MVEEIRLEPNWENVAAWHANALATHSFDYGAKEPLVTFIEQIRYLVSLDRIDYEAGVEGPGRIEKLIQRITKA